MITQTSDGYIWIAGGGLLRFDGLTLTPVLPQKSFPTEAGINWLLGSRDGSLWMATYRGLYRLKDGEAFSSPITRGGVESIVEDHNGAIWITRTRVRGVEGSLCRIVGNDSKCYAKDKSDGNPVHFATALAEDGFHHERRHVALGCADIRINDALGVGDDDGFFHATACNRFLRGRSGLFAQIFHDLVLQYAVS